jgi:hypothetical protein
MSRDHTMRAVRSNRTKSHTVFCEESAASTSSDVSYLSKGGAQHGRSLTPKKIDLGLKEQ